MHHLTKGDPRPLAASGTLPAGEPVAGRPQDALEGEELEFYLVAAGVVLLGIVALGVVLSFGGIMALLLIASAAVPLFAVTRLVDWLHDRVWRRPL